MLQSPGGRSQKPPKKRKDVEMSPFELAPSMFEQWYPQDGKKITATTNNINSMKRAVTIFFSKLYDCELSVTEIVEYLRLQTIGTFGYWYNTPGLLTTATRFYVEMHVPPPNPL